MAKQGKVLPARRPRGEESLLIRSAETLGRAIGKLQRQIDRGVAAAHGGHADGADGADGDGAMKTTRTVRARGTTKRASTSAAKTGNGTSRASSRKKK